MDSFYALVLLVLISTTPVFAEIGTECNPALETGIPCSPCLGKACRAHPAYLRPGTMTKEKEREAYARP
ncbi:hypothetical protein PMAYCL1PPCAC_03324 [Pristionchus mayeri]|uniref:Uncharacterized protein n=1 Tax=Pristionchus mayeri TaxID=1317129 RepID=A0AAN4Z4G0_9BILA|nr:hypothetical protein PMAYCL1PPCAC_03324 [Pristionchus mayeri]